ncbi:WYL domain-containing protein [bacterium]|nr:WYL domain-containing protein [bacterium]MBU1936397.1 WYL domain-containing protein [bacterium]
MNRQIYRAINSKFILEFWYNGGTRTVEPFCYGVDHEGNEVLRGYQTRGYNETGRSEEWKLFNVEKISSIKTSERRFSGERPRYSPDDPDMETIFCNV